MLKKIHKYNKGITLVEVLVTITITGILFVMIGLIASSFRDSYMNSMKIKDVKNEVSEVENYISMSIDYLNSNGYSLCIEKSEDYNFTLISYEEDDVQQQILYYENINKFIDFNMGDTILKLKYINTIDVNYLNDEGIVLTIKTIDNTEYVSYYAVLNLYGSV